MKEQKKNEAEYSEGGKLLKVPVGEVMQEIERISKLELKANEKLADGQAHTLKEVAGSDDVKSADYVQATILLRKLRKAGTVGMKKIGKFWYYYNLRE